MASFVVTGIIKSEHDSNPNDFFFSPSLREKTIKILSFRLKKSVSIETSVLFEIKLPSTDVDINTAKWIGWEPNDQGKYIPKCASLASSMDPQK